MLHLGWATYRGGLIYLARCKACSVQDLRKINSENRENFGLTWLILSWLLDVILTDRLSWFDFFNSNSSISPGRSGYFLYWHFVTWALCHIFPLLAMYVRRFLVFVFVRSNFFIYLFKIKIKSQKGRNHSHCNLIKGSS